MIKTKQFKNKINNCLLFVSLLMVGFNGVFAQENAIALDGTNDFVDCGNDASLNISGTSITLEAWIYPTSFQPNVWQGNVINKASAPGGVGQNGYMLRVGNGGQVNFNIGSGTAWNELNTAIGAVSLNTWHHIAGSYDGTTMRLYVDGVELITLPLSLNIGPGASPLYLGEDPAFPSRFFPGRIDEVRVWDVTRTPAEIIMDMNTNSCGPLPAGLKAYYRFNQGVAGSNNMGLTMVNDETGVNNGTLMNSFLNGTGSNWVTGTALSSSVTNTSVTICQGDSALIYGNYEMVAGIYSDSLVTVNGCDSIFNTTLIVELPITINTTASICSVDSILLGGAFQTIAGTYTDVFQTANGCDSIIVTVLSVNQSSSSTSPIFICQGDSAMINGVFQNTPGSYIDTLQTLAGCDSIINTVLSINPLPVVSIAAFNPDTICRLDPAFTLPTGTPILGSYSGIGVSGINFDPSISGVGNFFVTYSFTDGNGCSNLDSTEVTVEICVGIEEKDFLSTIKIFPNPVNELFTVQLDQSNRQKLFIKLVDVMGKTVRKIDVSENSQNLKVDMSNLDKGIYFLVITNQGESVVHKITKI